MKDFYIADAARFENQAVTSFFLLASISPRDRKGGGQYLALTLADKSGQFEARMWDDFADALASCTAGSYVKVQGQVSKYQGKFQITLSKMRLAAPVEIASGITPKTNASEVIWMGRRRWGAARTVASTRSIPCS